MVGWTTNERYVCLFICICVHFWPSPIVIYSVVNAVDGRGKPGPRTTDASSVMDTKKIMEQVSLVINTTNLHVISTVT